MTNVILPEPRGTPARHDRIPVFHTELEIEQNHSRVALQKNSDGVPDYATEVFHRLPGAEAFPPGHVIPEVRLTLTFRYFGRRYGNGEALGALDAG
ncbi:hypothetical protein [Streptomyces sp. NPDC001020]